MYWQNRTRIHARTPDGPDLPTAAATKGTPRSGASARANARIVKVGRGYRRSNGASSFAVAVAVADDFGPRHRAEQHSRARGKGAHVRAHGCASSRRPETGEQRRVRRSRAMPGSPSLWLLSLGETRESDSATAEVDETLRQTNMERVKRKGKAARAGAQRRNPIPKSVLNPYQYRVIRPRQRPRPK